MYRNGPQFSLGMMECGRLEKIRPIRSLCASEFVKDVAQIDTKNKMPRGRD